MPDTVSVSKQIAATPEQLYGMVSDLRRMGEWSPENQGGEWLDDGATARPGARFRGRNRYGGRSWKSVATVIEADPGRRVSFRVKAGPVPVSQWTYTFEPAPTGCRVTETWLDLRPAWFKPIARLATGVSDRPSHNRRGMEQTLERLGEAAESQAR